MTFEELWKAALGEIELQISRASFKTWFQSTSIMEKRDGIVTIAVPNGFTKEWLENKYNKFVFRALRNLDPEIKEVLYQIYQERKAADSLKKTVERKPDLARDQLEMNELEIDKATNLNPRYTFDNFIVGAFNELAHAAAQAVTQDVGKKYNPLFIYGGVGLGKTHLIQAIGNKIKEDQTKKVKYTTSEKFTSEVVSSIRSGNTEDLRKRWREIDLLIIDDIQFIGGKERTQDEFFHTFNALYEANKQIILSSDRPPQSIKTLEERLRSRFAGGMVADIAYPDLETRIAIIKSKAAEKQFTASDEVFNYIAVNFQKNIRELEGALNRTIANWRLSGRELTVNDAKRILSGILGAPKQPTTFKNIIKIVAEFYNSNEKELTERSRKKEIVKPRQVAMYLMREELKSSYPFIGAKLGGRDHTTAIHACEKIEKEINSDSGLCDEINMIREKLYSV